MSQRLTEETLIPAIPSHENTGWDNFRSSAFYLAVAVLLSWSLWLLTQGRPQAVFGLAVAYLIWESGLTTLLIGLSGWGIFRLSKREASGKRCIPALPDLELHPSSPLPTISVLIAAYNEVSCILDTIQSVLNQDRPIREIIISSDGSDDGMNSLLRHHYNLVRTPGTSRYETAVTAHTRLILLVLPRRGKGWALNSALSVATGEVVVTLDADTQLEPAALKELARPFEDGRTVAAGGFIFIRNAAKNLWLTKQQYVEYLKNFLYRIGLAQARICLQVSGAFGAFRRPLLVEIGGFSTSSLVEDYEVIYRLHRILRERHQEYRITIAPQAIAYTDGPENFRSFVHQRTRWFAGFLQTFWEYRFMLFNPQYGRIGWFILPIKTIDALLPIWGLGSLFILLVAVLSGQMQWSIPALTLFAAKWLVDVSLALLLLSWSKFVFPHRALTLSPSRIGLCVISEGLFFHWFRQAAVLNAYVWVLRRFRRWEQARWNQAPSADSLPKASIPLVDPTV